MNIRLFALTGTVLAFTLIAGAAFPSSEASARLGPGAGCPKLGTTADQYVDQAKLCRDARHELMRSLKTGKPADWIKVYRGALREPDRPARKAAAKHHHTTSHHTKARHSKPEHHLRSGIQHAAPPARRIQHPAPTMVTTTPPPKSPPPVPASKAPVVTTSATPPSTRTSALPASVGRHQPMASVPPGETSRSDAWDLWSVVVSLVLVAAALLVAFTARRRLATALPTLQPEARSFPVRVVHPPPAAVSFRTTAPAGLNPFAVSGLALTGAGALSVVRGLIMTMLTGRPGGLANVVLSRADAWNLLGIDTGDLVEEHIPGLVLTDDILQAKAHLRMSGPRRLFISCSGDLDLLQGILTRERGRIAAISLAPWRHATIEITADGQIKQMSDPELANAVTDPLPTLTRPEAYAQLIALPSVRTSTLLEARRQSTGR